MLWAATAGFTSPRDSVLLQAWWWQTSKSLASGHKSLDYSPTLVNYFPGSGAAVVFNGWWRWLCSLLRVIDLMTTVLGGKNLRGYPS